MALRITMQDVGRLHVGATHQRRRWGPPEALGPLEQRHAAAFMHSRGKDVLSGHRDR